MPRRCSVAGCRSNYDSQKETVSTFSLPKDEELKALWLRRIPTDFSHIKNPIVCIKHFEDSCIIKKHTVTINGITEECDRQRPKLAKNAIPTIFENCPKYLTSESTNVRRLADAEEENFKRAIKESIQTFNAYISENTITDFDDIIKYFKEKIIDSNWIYFLSGDNINVCLMSVTDGCPCILGCIIVSNILEVKVYIDKILLHAKQIPLKDNILKSTHELEMLMEFVQENVTESTSKFGIDHALDILNSLPEFNESENLKFFLEQINLSRVNKNARRYGNSTMLLASTLYIYSPSAYQALRKYGFYLPHPRNIRKLMYNIDLSIGSLNGSIKYLENRIKYLQPHEIIVSLIMDEIYINPQLNFKGGNIYGNAIDGSGIAKTVLVFMISSLFSKYKDVVALVPIYNLKSPNFKEMLLKIIEIVEQIGFEIISLVSDNNSVNRKTLELLTPNNLLCPVIQHPFDSSRKLFIIFDAVHILKCIRNNWERKNDSNRIIEFPDFDSPDSGNLLKAHFRHLELMYELEKSNLLKYGHTLSYKVLNPTNIEKQNVKLALKIFNENNVIALKHTAEKNPDVFEEVNSTCTFIKIIVNWWKIMNVKSAFEGQRFNDIFREPIRKDSNLQIEFLKKMSIWLKNWRQAVPFERTLSSQTFQALIISIDAFLELIPYIFEKYNTDYILLSKFQSDDLEGRFSTYRQLSGANYYISYLQVLENERKIRFKNTILFSSKDKNISIRTLLPSKDDAKNTDVDNMVSVDIFNDIITDNFSFELIPESIVPLLTYIGGYAVYKILKKKNCSICCSWLQIQKSVDVDSSYDFIKDLDRGRLILPTEIVVCTTGIVWHTMQNLINHPEFLSVEKHLSVLHKIALLKLENSELFSISDTCLCNDNLFEKLKLVSLTISRIMIHNYVKQVNDKSGKGPDTTRKIKKLNP